jgi:hypothetical protein
MSQQRPLQSLKSPARLHFTIRSRGVKNKDRHKPPLTHSRREYALYAEGLHPRRRSITRSLWLPSFSTSRIQLFRSRSATNGSWAFNEKSGRLRTG